MPRKRNSIAVTVAVVVVAQLVAIICWDIVDVVGVEFAREALPTKSGYLSIERNKGTQMFYAYYEAISPPPEQQKSSKIPTF